MNPKKTTRQATRTVVVKKIVEVVYWDCGNTSHNHRTEDVASRCMERAARKGPPIDKGATRQRNLDLARKVLSGATFKEAGVGAGVSPSRANQILNKVMRQACRLTPDKENGRMWNYNLQEARENNDYWIGRLDRLGELWGLREVREL